jgi:hypothetical protein
VRLLAASPGEPRRAFVPLVTVDPTCVLETLDQLLKERAPQWVTLVSPRIEDCDARGAGRVFLEFLGDEPNDRRLTCTPSSFEANGFASFFPPDEVGNSCGHAFVGASERISERGFIRQ